MAKKIISRSAAEGAKLLSGPQEWKGPNSHFRLDDLDSIVATLSQHCKSVVIQDGEWEYEDLREVKEKKGSRINRLTIFGTAPLVAVRIKEPGKWFGLVVSCDDTSQAHVAFAEIREIVGRAERVWMDYVFGRYFFGSYSLLLCLGIALASSRWGLSATVGTLVFAVYLGFYALAALDYYFRKLQRITLTRRHEPSALRDYITKEGIKLVLSNAVTAAIAFVAGLLLKKP